MSNKIDCDVFDNEIAAMRELIGNLESDNKGSKLPSQSVISASNTSQFNSKEVNKIKEMLERFP